jgi:regulator of cell morphogenesis and NO signaling
MTRIIPFGRRSRYPAIASMGRTSMIERADSTTIGDIVAGDFRTAAVFERFGIDFCCGGRRSLADACRSASTDPAAVLDALNALPPLTVDDDDVVSWPIDRLVDYILAVHHTYVRSALPRISRYREKLQQVHGVRHPELHRIAATFNDVSAELHQHMLKEEQVLFPYLRDLAANARETCGAIVSPFGTVAHPIRMMEREHEQAGDGVRTIRELTGGYTVPADGCTTYEVCMAELERFEHDLHRHVHLENNVLFPRAIAIENGS